MGQNLFIMVQKLHIVISISNRQHGYLEPRSAHRLGRQRPYEVSEIFRRFPQSGQEDYQLQKTRSWREQAEDAQGAMEGGNNKQQMAATHKRTQDIGAGAGAGDDGDGSGFDMALMMKALGGGGRGGGGMPDISSLMSMMGRGGRRADARRGGRR